MQKNSNVDNLLNPNNSFIVKEKSLLLGELLEVNNF